MKIQFAVVLFLTIAVFAEARSTAKKAKKSQTLPPEAVPSQVIDWKTSLERTKNLIIADRPYVLQFEEEESWGRVAATQIVRNSVTYSEADVHQYQDAVDYIIKYRSQLKVDCTGLSTQYLMDYLDQLAKALASFHSRAVPISGDISENNDALMLLVNRTTLRDSVVLLTRYFQAKRQAYIPSITKFAATDNGLLEALKVLASTLQVEISKEDVNRTYGLRDSNAESISLLPRNSILSAAKMLGSTKESACIVKTTEVKATKQAE